MGGTVGIVCAVVLHVAFLLFGGLLLPEAVADQGTTQEVELLESTDAPKDEQPPEEKPPEVEPAKEEVPDAEAAIRELEQPASDAAPALDAASLAAIGDALLGGGAGGDFSQGFNFTSGGRIGGTGTGVGLSESMDKAFNLADIDQKPRATFQAQPVYPKEMRGKRVEGSVTVIFVVDANGKVADPRVEKSSNAAFDRAALEAVRQWKFEPAVKAGKRVACKMRAPIRFPAQ